MEIKNLYNDELIVDWSEVAAYAQGTCRSESEIAATFEMSSTNEDLISDKLSDYDLFICDGCGWWIESGEMGEDQLCNDCEDDQNGR